MTQPTLIKIQGTIDNLTVWKGEEDFVMGNSTQAVGAATAVSVAAAGLAGAAASAAISSGDSADSVEFFSCTLNDKPIFGRFGIANFREGNEVIMAAEERQDYWEAYAVYRPKDRCLWMYPHCNRGNKAYWKVNTIRIFIASVIISQIVMVVFGAINIFNDELNPSNFLKVWFYITFASIGVILVGGAWLIAFSKFGRLSSTIFKVLDFKNPDSIDLEKRLKTYLSNNTLTEKQQRQYHFYSPWVYRY